MTGSLEPVPPRNIISNVYFLEINQGSTLSSSFKGILIIYFAAKSSSATKKVINWITLCIMYKIN